MRKQDFLLQLINSLSASEKRNFTLFTGILPGDKQYLKLFEAMQGKESYDADQLRKELNVTSQQLADHKHYLSEVLLKSIRIYDEDVTESTSISKDKSNAAFLSKRRMFNYALEVLDKALARSGTLEFFDEHMTMLFLKHNCLAGLGRLDEIAKVTAEQLRTLEQQVEYVKLGDLVVSARTAMELPQMVGEFEKLMRHPLLKTKIEKLKSVRAKLNRFTIEFFYAGAISDVEKILALSKKEFRFYKDTPQARYINSIAYAVSYTRMADAESAIGKYKRAIELFEQLKELIGSSDIQLPRARAESISFYADYKIAYQYSRLKNHQEARKTCERIEKLLDRRPEIEQYHIGFIHCVALLHENRLTESMAKADDLASAKTEVWLKLQPFVRAISVMIQLSIGNYELIAYQIRTARLWMKRNKISSAETTLFFSLVFPLAKASIEKRKELYLKIKSAIAENQLPEMEEELDLSGWVNSCLGDRIRRRNSY